MATPARKTRPKPPPPTLVLFVRHGVTPTTGAVLPGRAPGLHLSDAGRAQAQVVAERLAAWAKAPSLHTDDHAPDDRAPTSHTPTSHTPTSHTPSAHTPSAQAPTGRRSSKSSAASPLRIAAVYASPLERTQETATPLAAALGLRVRVERGLVECDFGAWTGAQLKDLAKLPEWTTVQRYPSGFRFPDGESFAGMQSRVTETVAELCARHRGEAVVAVSHADPIKAAVATALGTHLDLFQRIVVSPCSVTAISYGATGPTVLTVNSTGSLDELQPS